jgi:hypothetical protein
MEDKAAKYQKLANEYEILARDSAAIADKYKCADSHKRSEACFSTSQYWADKAKLEASRESLEDLL